MLKCRPLVALTRPSAPSCFDECQAFFWTWITAHMPNQSICFGIGMNKRNERSEGRNEHEFNDSLIIWIRFHDFVVYESLTLLFLFIQIFFVSTIATYISADNGRSIEDNIYRDLVLGEGFNPKYMTTTSVHLFPASFIHKECQV